MECLNTSQIAVGLEEMLLQVTSQRVKDWIEDAIS